MVGHWGASAGWTLGGHAILDSQAVDGGSHDPKKQHPVFDEAIGSPLTATALTLPA